MVKSDGTQKSVLLKSFNTYIDLVNDDMNFPPVISPYLFYGGHSHIHNTYSTTAALTTYKPQCHKSIKVSWAVLCLLNCFNLNA